MTISAAAQVQRCAEELGLVFFMCVFLPFPLSLLKFILPLSCHCESHTAGFPGVGGGGAQSPPAAGWAACLPRPGAQLVEAGHQRGPDGRRSPWPVLVPRKATPLTFLGPERQPHALGGSREGGNLTTPIRTAPLEELGTQPAWAAPQRAVRDWRPTKLLPEAFRQKGCFKI